MTQTRAGTFTLDAPSAGTVTIDWAAVAANTRHLAATKLVAEAIGIATAPGCLLTSATAAGYSFSHAVVVKPVSSGSSQGVSLVSAAGALPAALAAAFDYDDRVLIEDVIEGREIDIAVLGRPDGTRLVAPALEIVADGIFDFATKYGGSADFHVPARFDRYATRKPGAGSHRHV